ncbi:MAG TPA: hypothetical protein VK335_21005 [Bryobacteraceae bacterium]|nr:hypothetical protein [Bryobacteraceae bacterium]
MSAASQQSLEQERPDNDRAVFGFFNAIQAAAHQWQTELTGILDAPPNTPDGKQSMITEQRKRKPQIDAVVSDSLGSLKQIFRLDVKEHEWGAGALVELDLGWKDIENHWTLDADNTETALDTIRKIRDKLDEIVYTCISNTLTPDINDRLPNLEIGQALDLEFVYGDDFPRDPKLRQRLVLEVAQEQAVIQGGIVDAGSGLIYRIAPTARERRKSLWHVAGLIVLGGVLAAGSAFLGNWVPSWPIQATQWSALLMNYAFLFVGAGGHTVIDALKQKRAQTKPTFVAMDNWMLWLHVHEMPVLYSVLWADLGFILLTAMVHDLDWRGAFAAGYSIDSVTDLFLGRFESLVGKATPQIKGAASS